eukprot:1158384-Pelagomonas_calceolata.AAC.6
MNDDEIQAKWSKVGSTCWSDSLGAAGLNNKFQAKWLQQKPSRDSPTARPAGPNNKFQEQLLAECSSCEVTFQEKNKKQHQPSEGKCSKDDQAEEQGRLAGALGQGSNITTLQRTSQTAAPQQHTLFPHALMRRLYLELPTSTMRRN